MILKCMCLWLLALVLLTVTEGGQAQSNQAHKQISLLNSLEGENSAIRFFYQPPGDYFHAPLVFRATEEGSALLNTAPMREEGRTAYISIPEMQSLAQKLARADLAWQESEAVEVMGSYKRLVGEGIGIGAMQILVAGSKGAARARVAPKSICRTLEPLCASLRTARALWELQRFRLNYGCKVPGFKPDAYSDHD